MDTRLSFSSAIAVALTAVVVQWQSTSAASAQTSVSHQHETDSRVGVLSDFHEVIFQIWHNAWPEKNVALLVQLLPEVRHYSDTLARVELPGILRDKQPAWDEGIEKLQQTVTEYEAATLPVDSVRLLNAAESLHSQFETLARIIRPISKELDRFHQALYMIYHHYWPDRNLKELGPAVASLKEKMALLGASELPARLKKKEEEFRKGTARLAQAVDALTASDAANNPEKFDADLELLHAGYQALEQVCD